MNSSPQITAVEASAGSGKTYSLAKHYVKLLMQDYKSQGPQAFSGILAVTFTNKASYEMKQRILRMLKMAEFDSFRSDDERKELLSYWGVDTVSAKKLAAVFLDAIIGNYTRFQVRTIDSFINNVIMACSFDIDLPSHFDIEHDARPALSMALDSLIDDAEDDEDIRGKFTAFLHRLINIEQKVDWYPRNNILETVSALYSDAASNGGEFKISGLSADVIPAKKNELKELLEKLFKMMPEGTNANLRKGIEKALAMANGPGLDIASLSKYFQREEYQVNAKHEVPPDVRDVWKRIRKVLKDICEADSFTQFDTYIEIYNLMTGRFRELSRRDRVLFLPELNRIAMEVFDDAEMRVPELYFRLAANIRHYLLDEFQDTNELQWSNFKPMIDEAVASGGSLFYVGDKKQSIYRFRGANSSLFDGIKTGFPGHKVSEISLHNNWRSAKEIVGFNNSVFSRGNIEKFLSSLAEGPSAVEGLDAAVFDIFDCAQQTAVDGSIKGSVRVEYVDDAEEKAEDRIMKKTVEEVLRLTKVHGLSNVCLLCRDNREVEDISSVLVETGIPVESDKTLNIKDDPLIKELISFLKFLDSPVDDASFASFISGRMFSKASGISPEEVQGFLLDNRSDKRSQKTPLYKKFKDQYPSQWGELVQDLFRTAGFVPVYEYVIRIMDRYRAVDNFPEDHAYFMKLLDMICKNENKFQTIGEFLEYFAGTKSDIYVSAAGADAVKVMTVHKAKGLEFTAVIVPFLKMEPKISGPQKRSYVVAKTGRDLRLVRLKKEYNGYSDPLARIYNAEYVRSFCDELDNVYVALTRPVKDLIVFIPPKAGKSKNIVRGLVPQTTSCSSGIHPLDKGRTDDNILRIHPDKLSDPILFIKGDDFSQNAVAKRQSRVAGSVAHYLLSRIPDSSQGITEEILNAASGRYPYADVSTPKKWVERLLKNKDISKFFEPGQKVFTEKEIVSPGGEMNRIDRLIIKDNEVWVIDFKSSDDMSKDHHVQIKRYEGLLKQMYGRSAVRGFLIYFDTCKVEEL